MDDKTRERFDLFSTVVVDSSTTQTIRWFCHSIGQPVPGADKVLASREVTNLNVAHMLVDRRQLLRMCAIRIPATSPGVFQQTGTPYEVTPDDVTEFCRHAVASLCIAGDVPWVEFTPKLTRCYRPKTVAEVERGEGLQGVYAEEAWPASDEGMRPVFVRGRGPQSQEKPFAFERGVVLPMEVLVGRIEKFWGDLTWLNGPPTFDVHPDDPKVRGRLAVEFWMIGDEASPEDHDAHLKRVLGK